MDFKVSIKVGTKDIEVSDSAENVVDFFKKISKLDCFPTVGETGSKDLKFVSRMTKDGDYYLYIVDQDTKKEFHLGQSKKIPGDLFPKGWQEPFKSAYESYEEVSYQVENKVEDTKVENVVEAEAPKVTSKVTLPKVTPKTTTAPKIVVAPILKTPNPIVETPKVESTNVSVSTSSIASDILKRYKIGAQKN